MAQLGVGCRSVRRPVADWGWRSARGAAGWAFGSAIALRAAVAAAAAGGAGALAVVVDERTVAGKPAVGVAAAVAAGCNYTGADSAIDAGHVVNLAVARCSRSLSRGCL